MGYSFAEELMNVAIQQLATSTEFKKARMDRIKKYEDLYAGKSNPKLRIQFDAVLPIMGGMVDTLETEFDDPPYLKFTAENPAYYFKARKYQAAWDTEAHALGANAQWALKARWDKHNAILSGRGFLKEYAESDPEYKNYFDAVNYRDMHAEPNGGGHLENHLFCGQESIYRTWESIRDGAANGIYNVAQGQKLKERASSRDYKDNLDSSYKEKMSRFLALGQDPMSNSYVGQQVFNLVEWCNMYKGERWYLLFDPFTRVWLRLEKITDVFSTGYYPWVSWATHEDDRVFWSKSYGDDFYPSAQMAVDFMMQEYTNRNKRMLGAKFYDPSMVVDPAELNMAGYRPDQIIEINTNNGARKISEAVYELPVNELGSATIDLVNWVESTVGRQSGSTDLTNLASGGGAGGGKGAKANVVFAAIQQAQKRIGHKAHSYTEAYSQIGVRYMDGLDEHFTGKMPIKVLGPDGYEMDSFTRQDLKDRDKVGIKVTSKREEDQENVFGKNQKMKALEQLAQSPNINSKKRDETILRDVGGWDEESIQEFMDTQTFADQETVARASIAIDLLLAKKTPLIWYRANSAFMERIYNYALDRKEILVKKGVYKAFLLYIKAHTPIVQANMKKLAQDVKAGRKPAPGVGSTPRGQIDKTPAGVGAGKSSASGNPNGNVGAGQPVDMQ